MCIYFSLFTSTFLTKYLLKLYFKNPSVTLSSIYNLTCSFFPPNLYSLFLLYVWLQNIINAGIMLFYQFLNFSYNM